jgi:hypothetical protein
MKDLKIAKERLNSGESVLVVVKKGLVIAERQGRGIRPLFETVQQLGRRVEGSSIADKVIGKAAALLCIHYRVSAIYTPVMGLNAQRILDQYNLYYEADRIVPCILNNDGTDSCPLEKITAEIDDPDRGIDEIMRFLQAHTRRYVTGK